MSEQLQPGSEGEARLEFVSFTFFCPSGLEERTKELIEDELGIPLIGGLSRIHGQEVENGTQFIGRCLQQQDIKLVQALAQNGIANHLDDWIKRVQFERDGRQNRGGGSGVRVSISSGYTIAPRYALDVEFDPYKQEEK